MIVIVVIGILAAITVVAYGGIQERARNSSLSSSLSQASKKLSLYLIENSAYPANLSLIGVNDASNITYQYSPNNASNPQTFCVTATNGSTSYSIGQNSAPVSGACAGHGSGGELPITNLALNPGAETNATYWNGPNSSTVERDTTKSQSGTASIKVTMPIANGTSVGVQAFSSSVPAVLKPSTVYTISAYVYVPSSTGDIIVSIQGVGRASSTCAIPSASTSVKDSWVRLNCAFTTGTTGGLVAYVLNKNATTVANTQFWVDSAMITEGISVYNYGDGNSPNWIWNGTDNSSTSTGSPI